MTLALWLRFVKITSGNLRATRLLLFEWHPCFRIYCAMRKCIAAGQKHQAKENIAWQSGNDQNVSSTLSWAWQRLLFLCHDPNEKCDKLRDRLKNIQSYFKWLSTSPFSASAGLKAPTVGLPVLVVSAAKKVDLKVLAFKAKCNEALSEKILVINNSKIKVCIDMEEQSSADDF